MQSFEWKCKSSHFTWSLLAKLRNQEIVGEKRKKKTTNHKPPLPLRMGYNMIWGYDIICIWWFLSAVLVLNDIVITIYPWVGFIYKLSLQVGFVGKHFLLDVDSFSLSLCLQCSWWCQRLCQWVCGPWFFKHFKVPKCAQIHAV